MNYKHELQEFRRLLRPTPMHRLYTPDAPMAKLVVIEADFTTWQCALAFS